MDSMENGDSKGLIVDKDLSNGRTPQNVSSSILRKKSDPMLVSNIRFKMVRQFLANLQQVLLGTKLAVLFPAVPLAIVADFYNFGRVSAIYGKQMDTLITTLYIYFKPANVTYFNWLFRLITLKKKLKKVTKNTLR